MTAVTLFPHQEKGASFLAKSGGTKGLFFGMGTGKTITAIKAFERSEANAMLVIAPPIALPMWEREILAHTGLEAGDVQIIKTGKQKIDPGAAVLIASYAIATKRRDELNRWLAADCSALVCDESHALKSTKAQRTKAILGHANLATQAFYVWMLTGTPITRWNDDAYPFLARADMDGLKKVTGGRTLEKFQSRFTIRQKRRFPGARFDTWQTVGNMNTDELADMIYGGPDPVALRVDLDKVFEDMPPLTVNHYTVSLDTDAELRALLKELEKSSISEISQKLKSKEPALATIRRRLGVAKVKESAKEIAERVESGQNVLVGAWHTDVIDELVKALPKYSVAVVDGRTSAARREDAEIRWNRGDVQVLVGQIAAMGVSLNLQQGGSQIIVVEEDWSPAIMDQFYARLWRYGQEKHVHVDVLQSATKLDLAIQRINSTKASEQNRVSARGRELARG